MNQDDYNDLLQAAQVVGAAVGQNIFNPTALDRLLAQAYPGHNLQTDFYTYSVIFDQSTSTGLAAGVTKSQNIIIAADSDFVWLQAACATNIADATMTANSEVIPNVAILLVDTSSGRQLMDQAQPISNLFGNARYPYNLPQPRLIPAKTVLQTTVTNYDAASTFNLRLSFIGVKVFDLGVPTS